VAASLWGRNPRHLPVARREPGSSFRRCCAWWRVPRPPLGRRAERARRGGRAREVPRRHRLAAARRHRAGHQRGRGSDPAPHRAVPRDGLDEGRAVPHHEGDVGTFKSHVSHVVLDSAWEGSAAFQLEQAPRVVSYAKNERLDFEIPYEWNGRTQAYRPDFLVRVRLDDGREVVVILEMKGMEREQDRAKYAATEKWVRAVNRHGGFGMWAFMVCKDRSLRHLFHASSASTPL